MRRKRAAFKQQLAPLDLYLVFGTPHTLKLTQLVGGGVDGGDAAGGGPGREHQLVAGAEIEGARRNEERVSLENGVPQLAEFGDQLQASTLRLAGYVQDEWSLDARWSVHAGLRWEGIQTEGDAGDGSHPVNRSNVWTPLVHLLWKPDPKARDQVRLSLTRSYRSPGSSQLIARPWVNRRFPADGPNEPTHPDSAGNPWLQPELASGLDLAFERYLQGGGLLSANLFVRQLSGVIRTGGSSNDPKALGISADWRIATTRWCSPASRSRARGSSTFSSVTAGTGVPYANLPLVSKTASSHRLKIPSTSSSSSFPPIRLAP